MKWVPINPSSFTYLENTIFTSDIRMYFQKMNIIPDKFFVEQLCRINYTKNGIKRYLDPDGTFYYGDKIFIIEADRDTENKEKIKEKINNYTDCYLSQSWIDLFDKFPIILFVVPNEIRLKELLRIFRNNLTTDLTFLFTTKDLAKQNITGHIWNVPNNNKLYKII